MMAPSAHPDRARDNTMYDAVRTMPHVPMFLVVSTASDVVLTVPDEVAATTAAPPMTSTKRARMTHLAIEMLIALVRHLDGGALVAKPNPATGRNGSSQAVRIAPVREAMVWWRATDVFILEEEKIVEVITLEGVGEDELRELAR